jgi:putative transposase
MLPREFPPWPTVFSRFRRWRLDGTLRRAHEVLRVLARRQTGRAAEPRAAVIDSQSAKTTGVGGPARGYDGGKRVKGRKRHILVDVTGLLLAVYVHAADVQDREGARHVAAAVAPNVLASRGVIWADQGYTGAFAAWLHGTRGWRLEVVRHPDRQLVRYGLAERAAHTSRVLPRRWVVERTFAWLGQSRRLSKDYERLPATSEAMIYGVMSRLMLRRLVRPAAWVGAEGGSAAGERRAHPRDPQEAGDPEQLQRQPDAERRGTPASDHHAGSVGVHVGREHGDQECGEREGRRVDERREEQPGGSGEFGQAGQRHQQPRGG